MNINQFLTFMRLAIQSGYLQPNFFIKIIDDFLVDYFKEYPVLIELSLSKNADEMIDIIGKSDFFETEFYQKKLIGFIILAYENNSLTFKQYKNTLLDIFDTQFLDFTVEEIRIYLEVEYKIFDNIEKYLNDCKSMANVEMANFELWLNSL